MSTDAKGIHHLLWEPITVSASCCNRYVRKYPVVSLSGSLVFVFILYICFPLVFYYLACSSPIMVCTFVSIRFYLKTKHPESKLIERKNSDKKSNVAVKRSNKPSLSVRRNARMKVLEWDKKDSDLMNKFSPTTPYGLANLFREEMKMYSPRSPYGLSTLFGNPNSHESPKPVCNEKGRNGMEHGGSSSDVDATNDPALVNAKLPSAHSFQGQSGREEMDRFSPRTPYGIANLFREEMKIYSPRSPYGLASLLSNPNFLDENQKSTFDEKGKNSMEHGGSSSNIRSVNARPSRLSDSFREQSPRTPYDIANLFREEMKIYSPRSPYGLASLFSDPNFLDENQKSTFDKKGKNSIEHGGSSSNIRLVNARPSRLSDSFQEQSPRTPYDIANLFCEEMKMYSPRSPYCLSSLFSPKSVFEEKGRNDMEHVGSFSNDRELDNTNHLSSESFQGQSGRGPNGGGEVELGSMDEEDDSKKAVEWTEYDRNNVMVLGSLESERNQRLESLIAKRRARKLFKMTVDKSLMNTDAILPNHLAPILTAKSNLGFSNDSCEEVLQMPGSAPSLPLPKKNPFDLPYDPQEEKPNLMADSFQQEFMTANQKDYCRHESFCRKTFLTQDSDGDHFNHYYSTQRSLVEGPTHSRFKWQSGGHHHHNSSSIASDLDDSNHNKGMNSSERAMDEIKIGEKMRYPHDPEVRMDIGRNEVKMETDSVNNNDTCYTSSSEDNESVSDQTSKTSGVPRDRMRNNLNLSVPPKGRTVHALPCDFSPSPNERPRSDFNLFYGTYRHNHPVSTCSIASDLQVEVSEVGSPPLRISISSADDGSVTYDGDADKDINSDGEEVWGSSLNLSRGEANGEKLGELHDIIEEDSVEGDTSDLKRELEKPNDSPSPSEQEAKHVLNSKGSVASYSENKNPETQEDTKNADEKVDGLKTFNVSYQLSPENPEKTMPLMEKPIIDSKSSESRENGAQILVEAAREMKNPAEANGPGSTEHSHGNLETLYESKTPLESKNKIEGSHPSKHIEDTQNLEPKHDTGDAPNAVQSIDNLIANNVSGPNPIFDGSSSMVLNRRLVIEQIPQNPFSSPRSVLPENVLEDEMLLSDVEQPQVDLTYNMPQNAQQLDENSMDQLSGNSSLGTMEGSFNTTEKTTNYTSIGHTDKLVLDNMQGKGQSQKLLGTDPSKLEVKNAKSDDPETMAVKEKEPPNSSRKDEEAMSTANQGESQFSIGLDVIQGPEKSNQHEADVKEATTNGSENTSIPQSDSLNIIKNGEETQNLTGHDGTLDAPTESEVKPVEVEGNGSNAVAK
ncbi:hypothetical protein V6N13_069122 [Hibiscus sabdariffa]|uniref:Cardiomyopathy-associated protein 5 n=1 Tax=Hibiscus sabdariffa TaxID=183260 RepID=A0ABR2QPK6_9ROSI